MTVLNDADAVFLGSIQVDAVYCGTTLVWPLWAPTDFPNLTLWLDASTLSPALGATIAAWPDLSGNNRTVNLVGTPAPTISPTLKNGRKVVRFKVNEGRLRAVGLATTKDYTLVYVARQWGTTPGRIACATLPGGNVLFGWWTTYQDIAYVTNAFLTPDVRAAWTTNWKMYSADGASTPSYIPRLFSNGVLLSGESTRTDGWANTFNLSGYEPTGPGETSDAEVAEVVFYNRKLSDADRQTVESYLRAKWGL
jgi:hypothetical protein